MIHWVIFFSSALDSACTITPQSSVLFKLGTFWAFFCHSPPFHSRFFFLLFFIGSRYKQSSALEKQKTQAKNTMESQLSSCRKQQMFSLRSCLIFSQCITPGNMLEVYLFIFGLFFFKLFLKIQEVYFFGLYFSGGSLQSVCQCCTSSTRWF